MQDFLENNLLFCNSADINNHFSEESFCPFNMSLGDKIHEAAKNLNAIESFAIFNLDFTAQEHEAISKLHIPSNPYAPIKLYKKSKK